MSDNKNRPSYRSTTLNLVARHCPRALDFYESGAPYERSAFLVGVAAHAILEEIGKASAKADTYLGLAESEALARTVCEELISVGRDFEGRRDPPLPPDAVFRGRDLAMAYQTDMPLSPSMSYEVVAAVNRQWQVVPAAGSWLMARIDAVGVKMPSWMDDEGTGPQLEVKDYKSSWSADSDELHTMQRKIQAVLSWATWGTPDIETLKLVVVNFRSRQEWDMVIYPHEPEGQRLLDRWRGDIETFIMSLESQIQDHGFRPAIPGPGCLACPYLAQCADAKAYLQGIHGTDDVDGLARTYCVALAVLESVEQPLREATSEEPVEIEGRLVGTVGKWQRTLSESAPARLADLWLERMRPADLAQLKAQIPGLLMQSGLGLAQAEALLRSLFREKEHAPKRAELLAGMTGRKMTRRFGIHQKEKPSP